MGLDCVQSLTHGFLKINACTVFDLWLRVCGCEGLTVFTALHHFIYETWASADLVVFRDSRINSLQILWNNLSFWGVKNYRQISDRVEVIALNPCICRRSVLLECFFFFFFSFLFISPGKFLLLFCMISLFVEVLISGGNV